MKSLTVSPSICHEVMGPDAMILTFFFPPGFILFFIIYLFIFILLYNNVLVLPYINMKLLSFKPAFSLSSFTFIKKLFSSSLLSAIRVMSSAYLRLLIFLLAILIPACASSSPAFCKMYSAYKLNISLGASACKESAYNAQDPSSIPGLGRSPGEGNGNPLQYSCLENLMDRGAWWSTPHRLQKSDKLLNYKLGVLITIFLDLRSGYDSQGSGKCFPCC